MILTRALLRNDYVPVNYKWMKVLGASPSRLAVGLYLGGLDTRNYFCYSSVTSVTSVLILFLFETRNCFCLSSVSLRDLCVDPSFLGVSHASVSRLPSRRLASFNTCVDPYLCSAHTAHSYSTM